MGFHQISCDIMVISLAAEDQRLLRLLFGVRGGFCAGCQQRALQRALRAL